jgi:hypothetical protein
LSRFESTVEHFTIAQDMMKSQYITARNGCSGKKHTSKELPPLELRAAASKLSHAIWLLILVLWCSRRLRPFIGHDGQPNDSRNSATNE